ncbi:MFS transporter [Paracoccus sp. M683]|uniref:MFS transporter n=1 Tax=Paracoccus sp. M683 TaxID=2594268 RepID=UPI00117C2B3F|nr:MFS transporter [Paracoccus sp. M683]TRW95075.1 MFS transporter [Paracoccus sp. M683]
MRLVAQAGAPVHRRSVVSGAITAANFVGPFLSPIVIQPLITHLGYRGACMTGAVALAVLAAVLVLTPRQQSRVMDKPARTA